jgi:LuxR family maltose regulon positive regulatory protein
MVAALNEKTEGSVTGLRLTALAMRCSGDIVGTLIEPQADVQFVMEYLFNEVFANQLPECKQYLVNSAILDRFCGPLCDALNGPEDRKGQDQMDGWQFIAKLKKENLFLIYLDMENRWFRYHHLFQRF